MLLKIIGDLNNEVVSTMTDMYCEMLQREKDEILSVIIYSGGGNSDVFCCFMDFFSWWRARGLVETLACGEVMSGAPIIVAAGSPGHRVAMKHTLFGLHEPYLSETTPDPAVFDSEKRMLQSSVDRFYTLLSELTETSVRTWRNRLHGKSMVIFDARQALKWNLIDKVQKGDK